MKVLEEENGCLKKMYLEEKLKARIVTEIFKKSGEAISKKREGKEGVRRSRRLYTGCLWGFRITEFCCSYEHKLDAEKNEVVN